MSEEIGNELDEQLDLAGEGLMAPDEMDLAQDREDREAGESQTETAQGEEDLTDEKFVYTMPDGTEFEGTIEEIADKRAEVLAAERVQEELAKAKPAEAKPEEKAAAQEGTEVQPVDWSKTGDMLAERLGVPLDDMGADERAKLGEIGPMMDDAIHRTILTSPAIGGALAQYINNILDQRELGVKKETSFKEFAGAEISESDIKAFQQANPWAANREMAVLGLQLKAEREKGASTGKQAAEAEKKAKETGAQEAIKHLKATGRLRRVAGSGQSGAQTTNRGAKPLTEGQLVNAWASKAKELGAT